MQEVVVLDGSFAKQGIPDLYLVHGKSKHFRVLGDKTEPGWHQVCNAGMIFFLKCTRGLSVSKYISGLFNLFNLFIKSQICCCDTVQQCALYVLVRSQGPVVLFSTPEYQLLIPVGSLHLLNWWELEITVGNILDIQLIALNFKNFKRIISDINWH